MPTAMIAEHIQFVPPLHPLFYRADTCSIAPPAFMPRIANQAVSALTTLHHGTHRLGEQLRMDRSPRSAAPLQQGLGSE